MPADKPIIFTAEKKAAFYNVAPCDLEVVFEHETL
jgi:hypothetical protein